MMWDPSNPEMRRRIQISETRTREEQQAAEQTSRRPQAPRRRDRLGLVALVVVTLLIVAWVVYLLHTGTFGPPPPAPVPTSAP